MSWNALATFATAMFTILNPIGNTAIFAGMVAGRPDAERRVIAIKCTLAVAVILVVTIWLGEQILKFFGVSTPTLEVAGGLIIAIIGMSMLHAQQSGIHSDRNQKDGSDVGSIAVVPLAMPVVAGPGAIATAIVNTDKYHGIMNNMKMSVVCLAVAAVIGICFLSVGPITRLLGTAGMNIVTRFMGLILLAIAVGMMAAGAKGLLPGLG